MLARQDMSYKRKSTINWYCFNSADIAGINQP